MTAAFARTFITRVLPAAFVAALVAASAEAYTPSGPPLATGKTKYLGCGYDTATQGLDFEKYFNQITPGNAAKWGSVEYVRDVMNWTELDAAYQLAKTNHFSFKLHTLIWGAQQPSWVETLSTEEQLQEIQEWFAALAARYPDVDMIDVVNEPMSDPPDRPGEGGGNYIKALGGTGTTGYDWVIRAFQMARFHFPRAKLLVNEYNVTNFTQRAQSYVTLIKLLKDRGLIDAVGIQGHAFSTTPPNATLKANLDIIAAAGLPIYITEMDVDGPTDQVQLDDYKRLFPLFWEHPSVKGITLWGFRPGLWRQDQGAYIVQADGTERPALVWLRDYLQASANGAPLIWNHPRGLTATRGEAATLKVSAAGVTSYQWYKDGAPIAGATGASLKIDSVSAADAGSYRVEVAGPGGSALSDAAAVSVAEPRANRLFNISTRSQVGTDGNVMIAGFIVSGDSPKTVLLRAWGPTLAQQPFNVAGSLADPVLTLFQGDVSLASNDNWGGEAGTKAAILQAAQQVGAYHWPDGSKEAALLVTLEPGDYTAIVSGKGRTTGVSLIEGFEVGAGATHFYNVSTRSVVLSNDGVQIAGFIVRGDTPKKVVIRASGPALTKYGVPGVLENPMIEVRHGNDLVAKNDDWDAAIRPDFQKCGIDNWAVGSKDAALVLTLNPGDYTAIVSGKDNGTGVALVEVYEEN